MDRYLKEVQIRWSDFDPNLHVTHTSYYQFGALSRVDFLKEHGLTMDLMHRENFGPVLFREECLFKREIRPGEKVFVELFIRKSKRDFSKWTLEHPITKGDGTLAAVVSVDGAMIDRVRRKLIVPPPLAVEVFMAMPRSENFEWLD